MNSTVGSLQRKPTVASNSSASRRSLSVSGACARCQSTSAASSGASSVRTTSSLTTSSWHISSRSTACMLSYRLPCVLPGRAVISRSFSTVVRDMLVSRLKGCRKRAARRRNAAPGTSGCPGAFGTKRGPADAAGAAAAASPGRTSASSSRAWLLRPSCARPCAVITVGTCSGDAKASAMTSSVACRAGSMVCSSSCRRHVWPSEVFCWIGESFSRLCELLCCLRDFTSWVCDV
mmetsp:Transcript_26128/g.77512  ORF Transcript_26128/g.77512 Transcript_26128/m.77512 type:complete len:234 (+) Transcript_26128:286-987(+)